MRGFRLARWVGTHRHGRTVPHHHAVPNGGHHAIAVRQVQCVVCGRLSKHLRLSGVPWFIRGAPLSIGGTMTVASKLLKIAKAEVGYREGRNANGSYNNDQKYSDQVKGLEWSDRMAWCQTFQAWLAMKAGSAAYEPKTASCWSAVNWFRQRGRFSWYPAIGAQVFF